MAAFLGRARYERAPEASGSRNGHRPRRVQTAEGEIIPDTRAIVRTRPLEALVIGAYVRGLSDRDVESLARGCWRHPCMGMNPPVMATLVGDGDALAVQRR
jgi:transposase-like protein